MRRGRPARPRRVGGSRLNLPRARWGFRRRSVAPPGWCHRAGIGLFIEDGAYTTLASAVSILVALTLAFSAATAAWSVSRAGDVQVAADTTALAGANVVASYHTAATTVDASILSLGLTGLAVTGAGLAGLLVPAARPAAAEAVDTGVRILKARNEFAASASRGLQSLERALPYLVAANAARTCLEQGTGRVSFTGTALAVPRATASEFPALAEEQIPTGEIERSADELDASSSELSLAAEEVAKALERAWLADCGRQGRSMRERAARLSGITEVENPLYASSVTWRPQVGLDRARAYYRWRAAHEVPEGSDIEARVDAAARRAFYRFAADELGRASIHDVGERVSHTVPLLPRNVAEVRGTSLYTTAMWPSSRSDDGLILHFDVACPGSGGEAGPVLALQAVDSGVARTCASCQFDINDLGSVPAASTSIDNGFEFHLREYTRALDDYVGARNRELELERRARRQASRAVDAFEGALSGIAGKRPRIAPPGRAGCVAFVVSGALSTPDELAPRFSAGAEVPARGAVSAAVAAPDRATAENNALGEFFSTLEERAGGGTVTGLVGDVMDVWGRLLVGYGDLAKGLDELMDGLLGGAEALGAGPIASWLGERARGALIGIGLEPVDLSFRKPVLTDSSNVLAASDVEGLADTQSALRSLPIGTTDPAALMRALRYEVGERIASAEFMVAEIPLPGGGSVPLTIRVRDVVGGLS